MPRHPRPMRVLLWKLSLSTRTRCTELHAQRITNTPNARNENGWAAVSRNERRAQSAYVFSPSHAGHVVGERYVCFPVAPSPQPSPPRGRGRHVCILEAPHTPGMWLGERKARREPREATPPEWQLPESPSVFSLGWHPGMTSAQIRRSTMRYKRPVTPVKFASNTSTERAVGSGPTS